MLKKFVVMMTMLALVLSMAACGNSGQQENAAQTEASNAPSVYTYFVDPTSTEEERVPMQESLFLASMGPLVSLNYGAGAYSLELTLNSDNTFALFARTYNPKEGIAEGDGGYLEYHLAASGIYTMDGNAVTIRADKADLVFKGGAYVAEVPEIYGLCGIGGSLDQVVFGEWNSDEYPEVLECVPETNINVNEDGAIVNWELIGGEGSPNDAKAAAEAPETTATEPIDVEATETVEQEVILAMLSPDWDAVVMNFYADNTCVFALAEYGVEEKGTWALDGDVLTVTREDGVAFTSVMEENVMKLNYTAAMNDQLVGKFACEDWSALS